MKNKEALEVLRCWLSVAYQNTDGTDESSAELYEALQTVFNLINRQQAKIDALQMDNEQLQSDIINSNMNLEHQQAEIESLQKYNAELAYKHYNHGIKEFAQKLKENIAKSIDNYWNNNANGYYLAEDVLDEIDILIKDMGR